MSSPMAGAAGRHLWPSAFSLSARGLLPNQKTQAVIKLATLMSGAGMVPCPWHILWMLLQSMIGQSFCDHCTYFWEPDG